MELRVVEGHLDPQRPEALDSLQLPDIELLEGAGQIAEALQVLDVRSIFERLGGLAVDDRHFPGLRQALGGPVNNRLVDSLLDDLVPDVVGPVDVEALFVEPEPD